MSNYVDSFDLDGDMPPATPTPGRHETIAKAATNNNATQHSLGGGK